MAVDGHAPATEAADAKYSFISRDRPERLMKSSRRTKIVLKHDAPDALRREVDRAE